MELTAVGAVLLDGARRLLVQLEQILAQVRWIAGQTEHVLRVGYLDNGLVLLGVGSSWQLAIKGALIIVAVAFSRK